MIVNQLKCMSSRLASPLLIAPAACHARYHLLLGCLDDLSSGNTEKGTADSIAWLPVALPEDPVRSSRTTCPHEVIPPMTGTHAARTGSWSSSRLGQQQQEQQKHWQRQRQQHPQQQWQQQRHWQQQSWPQQQQQQHMWHQPCRAFSTQASATASIDDDRQKRIAAAKAMQGRFYDTVKVAEVEGQVRSHLQEFVRTNNPPQQQALLVTNTTAIDSPLTPQWLSICCT